MKEKFKIIVEDYNVPFTPWHIINRESFSIDLKTATKGKFSCDTLFIFEKDRVFWGPRISQFTKAGQFFAKKIISNKKYQQKLIDTQYKYLGEIEDFAKKQLNENLKTKSKKDLFKIFSKYYYFYKKMQFEGVVMGFIDMGDYKLVELIKKEISEEIGFINFDKDFSKLITPNKQLYYGKENLEILKTIKKIQINKTNINLIINSKNYNELPDNLKNIFNNLAKKYGWLQYYYFGPSANGEYYFNVIKLKIKINAEKEIIKKKKEEKELINFQNNYKKKLSPQSQEKIDILKELIFLKEYRKEIQVYFLNYSMDKWFKEIAKRYYITPILARYILLEEYKNILLDSKTINTEELNKRYNNCAYLLENGKIKLYSGEQAKKCWKLFYKEKNNSNVLEIYGSIAYPGKRKGVVKIVNSTNDLAKFKKGDILVSYSTNPSLMPALNIASAIITNTGGITCHAAIISRELKIPCIIGTNNATKILKDGDIVEVDADNGVVKILK